MLPSKLTPNLLQSCFSSLEFHLVHPLLQHLSLQKPVVPDSEETLMLAEESHSKMLLKQKDPMMLEKKVNTTLNSINSSDPTLSSRPTKVEIVKQCGSAHSDYLKHTQEEAAILREIVEQGKSQNPLNESLDSASRHGLVRGLPKLKFEKDHMCSACAMGNSKKKPRKPKSKDTNQEKLYLLHMDHCGPMHVASVNGKKRFIKGFLEFIKQLLFGVHWLVNTAAIATSGFLCLILEAAGICGLSGLIHVLVFRSPLKADDWIDMILILLHDDRVQYSGWMALGLDKFLYFLEWATNVVMIGTFISAAKVQEVPNGGQFRSLEYLDWKCNIGS
ncbi:hypothetical protein Tco_0418173 [Tanacetum coccineum]